MENLSTKIDTIIIQKGQGVLDAIIAIARKNGISYTRRELHNLTSDICSRVDNGKSLKNCIVQPNQTISINKLDLKLDTGLTEIVPGIAGFVKYRNSMGETSYTLNGRDMPKVRTT